MIWPPIKFEEVNNISHKGQYFLKGENVLYNGKRYKIKKILKEIYPFNPLVKLVLKRFFKEEAILLSEFERLEKMEF